MKKVVVLILVLLGIYWLVDHASPLPLNHEQFGLYNHMVHRLIGIVCFVAAGVVFWKWHPKKKNK